MDTVNVIARGYEWVCPICDLLNKEIEYTTEVCCKGCYQWFKTEPPEHAIG